MSKPHPFLFFAWVASVVCPAVAQETAKEANATLQPKISADQKIVLDQTTGQMIARGKARLEYGTLLLLADEIRYLRANGQAFAKGNVILTFGEVRILADELDYLLGKERLSAKDVRFGRYPLAGESETLVGSLKGLSTASNATIYLFEPKPLEPNFMAKEIVFDEETGILKANGLRLRIGQTTVLGLPKIETQRRKSPFEASLSAGHDDHLGASVEIHSLFDIRPNLRVGGSLEGYSKRGVLIGPEARYGLEESSLHGSFSSGFIKDENPVGLDVQGTALLDDRGFLDWSHQQRINDNLSLAAQVEWRQDSEVFRDFRQEIFQFNQWNDSFAELTYSKGNTMASLFARAQPNQFADQIERKPEIGFYLLPTELLDSGVYHSASLELVGLEESNGNDSTEIESDRADITYHLSRYFKIAPWLSLMPSATYRMARYWDALGSDNSLTRHFGEFGLDARIPFHAQFEVQNELWEINGLRHKGSVLFQYRYLNDSRDGDRDRVPLLDRRYFDPNLAPLDLREIRYLDDLVDRNLIRIGIENQLQTRAEKYGSRDLAALRVYQDVPLDPEPGQESDDALFSEVEVQPAAWIAFGLQAKIDTKQGDLQQLALESRLLDADLAELSLSFLRLEDRSNQYRLLGFRRLDERRELQTGLQFDAKTGNLTRASVGVYSRLSNSWDLAYLLTHRKGTAREDDLAFRLGLRMLEF